jgi:putative transposase
VSHRRDHAAAWSGSQPWSIRIPGDATWSERHRSQRRCDAALYDPYTRPDAGRGPRRKYGRKGDDANLPVQYLTETTGEGPIQTRLYQAPRLHKECAHLLHGVMIAKTNLRTQARAHVVLFRSDFTLTYAPLVDY